MISSPTRISVYSPLKPISLTSNRQIFPQPSDQDRKYRRPEVCLAATELEIYSVSDTQSRTTDIMSITGLPGAWVCQFSEKRKGDAPGKTVADGGLHHPNLYFLVAQEAINVRICVICMDRFERAPHIGRDHPPGPGVTALVP